MTAPPGRFPRAALFDLDGTLLDSAPDMVATVNRMLADRGRPPIALDVLRPHVSKGSRAMSAVAFPELSGPEVDACVPEFLRLYAGEMGRHSVLFDGVAAMLEALDAAGCTWGIVTNKPEYLARDILPQLGWESRCAVLVGGDTYAHRKPHPMPLLKAAESIGIAPAECVYIGDDERDILAARAAGMPSIAALWGYRLQADDPETWGADVVLTDAPDLQDPDRWPQTARPAA